MSTLRNVLVTASLLATSLVVGGCASTVSAPSEQAEGQSGPNASASTTTESPSDLIASFRKTTPATPDAWLSGHAAALNALDSEGAAEVKNAVIEIVALERGDSVGAKSLDAKTLDVGEQPAAQPDADGVMMSPVAFAGSCSRTVCGGGILGDLKCLGSGCYRGCSYATAVCYEN